MTHERDTTAGWPTPGIVGYAPGGIGNLGPGLDVLGCAVTGAGDAVHAAWCDAPGVHIADAGHPALPTDAAKNACGIAATAVLARVVHRSPERPPALRRGVVLTVRKGLPLSAGQGGSSASAVAAAVAVNQLIFDTGGVGLDRAGLLDASLQAEAHVSGRHLDNIASALMGGVICVLSTDPPDVTNIPVVTIPWFALAHPNIQVRTADARAVLPATVSRAVLITQLASVASLVTALTTGDLALLGRSMTDHVAEVARLPLIPGLANAKAAAMQAGAVGAGISGSGPTTFAVCATEAIAHTVAHAMQASYEQTGHQCTSRVATIDFAGATWSRT